MDFPITKVETNVAGGTIDTITSITNPVTVESQGLVSTTNSTSANLGGGAAFTGTWEDSLNYGTISIGILSDQDSAVDGLAIEYSADGATKIQDDTFSIFANTGKTFTFSPTNRYFRIVYTNGATPTTSLNIQTILKPFGFKPSSHNIKNAIVDDDDAELVKAVLTAKQQDLTYSNVGGPYDPIIVSPPPYGVDAFGQQVVAEPFVLHNAMQLADENNELYFTDESGSFNSLAYQANQASSLLSIGDGGTSADGDYISRASRYIPYVPAHGTRVIMTLAMDAGAANVVQEVGQFDVQNGIFLRRNNTDMSFVIRTFTSGSAVENEIAQASWNLDTMDGNGPSGKTIDFTKRQILVIDYQWLGVGKVLMGFDVGNAEGVRWCHEFDHVNRDSGLPYSSSPTLPVCYRISADGGTVASKYSLRMICASVVSFGADDLTGVVLTPNNGVSLVSASNSAYTPILAIRPTSKNVPIILDSYEVLSEDENVHVKVLLNPTSLTGGSWAASAFGNIETRVPTSYTNGDEIGSFYVVASTLGSRSEGTTAGSRVRNKLYLSFKGDSTTPEELLVVAQSLGTGASGCGCTVTVEELL